jgi:hypothetical protein
VSEFGKALHKHYSGKVGDALLRVGELLAVAAVVGIVTLYSGSAKMSGIVDRVCVQLDKIENKLDAHISNYAIHTPHMPHDKSEKGLR